MKHQKYDSDLHNAVSKLSYSREDYFSGETFEATLSELQKIWAVYGFAEVLGELYTQWSLEKALPFFEKLRSTLPQPRKVKTIATLYHRGYNGGCERVQAQLMTLWVNMGYRVVFFSEEPANPMDFPYPDEVKRILIPGVSNLRERLLTIQELVLEEGVDVLVNHDWSNSVVMWEAMLMKMLGASYVNYIHSHFSWSISWGKYGAYSYRIFKLCDVVLALSETNARFFQLCGCNTYLVENPVPEDLSQITELAPLKSRHVLLLGRISGEKYPMEAVRAFKMVHDVFPDVVLDVVGADNGNNVKEMTQYCLENDLSDSVVFHGLKNKNEVNQFLHNSSCMLFTSKMEGYPMVLLEAKAHGLPIAMYDLSFLTLVKGRKGILTAPIGDVEGVAKNVIRLLSDDELRNTCGRAAREDFEWHNAYDLHRVWADVFALCERENVVSEAYYDPENVPNVDRLIEPALLDEVAKAYENILKTNFDYNIGRKVLKIPRAIKKFLLKLKGLMISS